MKKSYQNKNKKITLITVFTLSIIFSMFSTTAAYASPITKENLEKLVNQERVSRGLPALNDDGSLDNAATLKAKDMVNRDYFEHYAFGLSPWDFIDNAGYNYLYAGENLAMDFQTSEGMVNAWMNSPAHRDNILNPEYRDMGIGVVKGEYSEKGTSRNTIVVSSMFGRQKPPILKIIDSIRAFVIKSFF